MQSQLEAALLGHSTNLNHDDDENNFQEEETEDNEEFDEDTDGDHGKSLIKQVYGRETNNRTVTLQMLLSAGILEPGAGTMTIEYLGQKFVGDLLEDGKIKSQETDIVFASPSAWAIACKRFINPDKKSGCGWASVKYRGINLEQLLQKNMSNSLMYQRIVVKHNTIANRTLTHDANTMIDCVPFSNLGKIQPFLVSLSTNAALLMDFHCHLTKSEVSGYLAGYWDVNAHNLQITHAFPCRSTKADRENAPHVESEISKAIEREKLILVGWYHSHPFAAAAPTLRDVDAQLDYQIKMKGTSDNNYTPCIGIIISPYNYENTSLESSIIAYWVIPPPEAKPNEYGRPMLINTCYIDKLKSTLISKFPRDESETSLWRFIRENLGISSEEKETLLSIPNVSKSSLLPNLNTPVSLSSNLMLPTDISSILFNSGKFPSASSLLGLPDPMAHSTLAANNMFLQTNLFKMQELLKPLSTSSPITSKSKSEHKSHSSSSSSTTSLKIPTDIKGPKQSEYSMDILGLKSKMDFHMPDLSLSKLNKDYSVADYISNLSKLSSSSKQEFSIPDLSISKSSLADYTLNSLSISKQCELGEKLTKIPKMDYSNSMLDLSVSKNSSVTDSISDAPTDLSVGIADNISSFIYSNELPDDRPLNLAGE
ncbi:hypothetical protein NQ314_017292 [Rhamnusium bicolor]|uniref:MPN domain-containing protein n=1 Tax=Rhamnusium bicolor TaxID=1586634 RepID=A0AAV8WTR0_9CUCU|nr:hypothetical protein NQ314_017292 [Rhamnusium bicolor]